MTRRRWVVATTAAVTLAVGLAAAGHLRSGGNPDDSTVASGRTTDTLPSYEGLDLGLPAATTIPDPSTQPTSIPAAALEEGTARPATAAPQPATAAAPARAPAPAAAPARPPVPAPSPCRNSFEPRCGDFFWDPPPRNAPARIDVRFDPPLPIAGQPVTVTLRGEDPDALAGSFTFTSTCRSDDFGVCGNSLPSRPCGQGTRPLTPHGGWEPPAPPSRELRAAASWSVVFAAPGNHSYTARFETSGATPDSWLSINACPLPQSPYNSTGTHTAMIAVSS